MQVSQHYQLTLKIKNRYVDIKLNLNDTKQTIYQKIIESFPDQKVDLQDLVNKIKKQLFTMNSRVQIQKQARQVAREIVNKIYKKEKSPIHSEWAMSEIAVNSRAKSCASESLTLPEKVCYQKCIQTQQTQLIEENSSKGFKNESFSTYSLNKTEDENKEQKRVNTTIQLKKSERSKKMSLKITNANKSRTSKQQKETKKKCNPDMIKACEAIMKKSNHNAMKNMAKEFLKEKGYLAEDLISHQRDKRRTYLVSQISQNPQKQRLQRQKQSENRRQRQQTVQSKVLVQSTNINLTDTSSKNTKGRSKYSYNITPTTDTYSYFLNGRYQNEPFIRMTEASVQKCAKKYNYLQN